MKNVFFSYLSSVFYLNFEKIFKYKSIYFLNKIQLYEMTFLCKYFFSNFLNKEEKERLASIIESFALNIIIKYGNKKHYKDFLSFSELCVLLDQNAERSKKVLSNAQKKNEIKKTFLLIVKKDLS